MLAGVELAINTLVRRSTVESPFMITHGRGNVLPCTMPLSMSRLMSKFGVQHLNAHPYQYHYPLLMSHVYQLLNACMVLVGWLAFMRVHDKHLR